MNTLEAVALGVAALTADVSTKDHFIQHIHSKVFEIITQTEKLPALNSEDFEKLKPGLIERWNTVVTQGVFEVTVGETTDAEERPYLVHLQGIVEHVLSSELKKSVDSLTGVIHTPMPATPLCTEGEISPHLVDPSMEEDSARLATVKARTTIVRDFLHQGGEIYMVYPKDAPTKRTEAQLAIYKRVLEEEYPTRLHDYPLDCESIENELVGAFYVFKSEEKVYAFAIKIPQAASPGTAGVTLGLWFSELSGSSVEKRISEVLAVINSNTDKRIPLPSF